MKAKKCKQCSAEFMPDRIGQKVCGYKCAAEFAKSARISKAGTDARKMKREMLSKDRGHWMKKAQSAFNAYIRARDASRPCISCGRHHSGQYHAGHYRPAGVNAALRFDERNTHKQCSPCNNHKSGNLVEYRANLISKIGADAVEWLDNNHETKRWTLDELKAIESEYKTKLKALQASK